MSSALFNLFGVIGMKGVEDVNKHLTNIDKQVKKVQREMVKFGKNVENVGKQLTKSFTVPLVGASVAIVKGIKDASDLSETIAKTGEIFGASADEIVKWSAGTATALGQSKIQALDAASNFAIFGKAAGLTGDKLVSFSTDFVKLASDLASFNNTSPEDAILAIGSALRGEAEPMRRYGVLLDDASLRQEALKLGLIATTKQALTPQTKVLAAQALIFKQTKDAQGDFERTSAGLANQQRILAAEIKNVSADLGAIFLPLATKVFGLLRNTAIPAIQGIVNWFKNLSEPMQKTIVAWGALAAGIGPVLIIVGKIIVAAKTLVPLIKLLTFSQAALNSVMAANPIGLVVTAIALLIAGVIALYNNWDTVTEFLSRSWSAFTDVVSKGVSVIKEQFLKALSSFLGLAESMTSFIPGLGDKVSALKTKFSELAKQEKASREERAAATANTKSAIESTGQYNDAMAQTVEKVQEVSEVESQAMQQRKALEEEWTAKFLELTATREEKLAMEKAKALAEAEKLGMETDTINAYYAELEKQRLQEITDKKVELETLWNEKVFEATASRMEILTAEKEKAILDAEEKGASIKAIEEFYALETLRIEEEKQKQIKDFQDARQKEYDDYLIAKKEKDIQARLDRAQTEEEWNQAHSDFIEMRKLQIQEERDNAIKNAEEVGANKTAIDQLYTEKINDLSQASMEMRIAHERQVLAAKLQKGIEGFQAAATTLNTLDGLMKEYYSVEIARIEDRKNKQIKAIEMSSMTQEQKTAAIKDIETKSMDEVAKKRKEEAKRSKELAVFQVIINSALAIMKVAADAPGFFTRIIAIAAITALGIAQVALIKRRPIPSFAKGGMIKSGRGGTEALIGEGMEDEVIFPLKTGVDMFIDRLLSKLNGFKTALSSPVAGGMSVAGTGGTVNFHIGTLIADEEGIKKLERSMRKYRIQENQRRGYDE